MDRRAFLSAIGGAGTILTAGQVMAGDSRQGRRGTFDLAPGYIPEDWSREFRKLFDRDPPTVFPEPQWSRILAGTRAVYKHHIRSLISFDWTLSEVFAVDATHPTRRLDHAGLLCLLDGAPIEAICRTRVAVRTPYDHVLSIYRGRFDHVDHARVVMLGDL